MLAEIVLLLTIANIVLIVLIMKQLHGFGFKMPKMSRKAQFKESIQDDDDPEPMPEPDKMTTRIRERFHLKKHKSKRHISEMPDMENLRNELESEFKKGSKKHKKGKKNEIQDRLEEIEKN